MKINSIQQVQKFEPRPFVFLLLTCSWCWTQLFFLRETFWLLILGVIRPNLWSIETDSPVFGPVQPQLDLPAAPVVGVRGLLRGHLSDGNEEGASAAFFTSPKYIYPTTPRDLTAVLPVNQVLNQPTWCHLKCILTDVKFGTPSHHAQRWRLAVAWYLCF